MSIKTASKKEKVVEKTEDSDDIVEEAHEAPTDKFIRIDTKHMLPPKP